MKDSTRWRLKIDPPGTVVVQKDGREYVVQSDGSWRRVE